MRKPFVYVFKKFDANENVFTPHFNLLTHTDKEIEEEKKNPEFFIKNLYGVPYYPYGEDFFHHQRWQLSLLTKYMAEVFQDRYVYGGGHRFYTLILSKSVHNDIMNLINDNRLLMVRDLLFEIIALGQEKYIRFATFLNAPSIRQVIKSGPKEMEKLKEIVTKVLQNELFKTDAPGQNKSLLNIKFTFGDETIKIENDVITGGIISLIKDNLDKFYHNNPHFSQAPDNALVKKNTEREFISNLSIALYSLLSENGFFDVTNYPTPENLVCFIRHLMEYCLIPIGNPDADDSEKNKNIRNWISRHKYEFV